MVNCHGGHGAVDVGSVAVTHSIAAWGLLCDQDWACMGFVYMTSQGKCWKRAAIQLNMCEVGVMGQESSDFTTFTKKQLQQSQPLQRYEAHPMVNCYSGHGAVEIGSVAVTHSIAACGLLCDQDWACMGF